jgi:hypothetical protein
MPRITTTTAIHRVGAALLERHGAIAEAMVARIVTEVPTYRRASRATVDDVLVLATPTAELLARTFAAGTPLRREDIPVLREQAARRVHQGVGLEAFLHAYRVALAVYWEACTEEATRLRLTREHGFALARFALETMDTMTTHAAEAYLREETRVRTSTGRAVRDLVEQLVGGTHVDDHRRDPAAPGLDPTASLVVVVAAVDATATTTVDDALQGARDAVQATMSLGRVRPLVAIRQGEVVAIAAATSPGAKAGRLADARERLLERSPGIDVRFGLSAPAPGFAGVRQGYREAALALSHASATRPIVALADLSSLETVLLGADAATRAVIAAKGERLRALEGEERAATVATVRAFAAADLNVARAARALHVHPNTVRYRLERIASTTGHDPRSFVGLVELTCLVELSAEEAAA